MLDHDVRAAAATPPRRRAPASTRFDLAVCAGVFAAVSMWVVAVDLWQVVVNGRVWTGTDGVYIVDQMQYLAWIRDASHHVLSSNLFVLRSTPPTTSSRRWRSPARSPRSASRRG